MSVPASVLFLGWGNPSRGDDALGPLLCDRLSNLIGRSDLGAVAERTEVQQDFQLQVEDASDINGRDLVVFIDASLTANAPFVFSAIGPAADAAVTSHALSPQAVLEVAREVFGATPPSYLLAVRGEAFELGAGLSVNAALHLEAAWRALHDIALAEDPAAAAAQLALAAGG